VQIDLEAWIAQHARNARLNWRQLRARIGREEGALVWVWCLRLSGLIFLIFWAWRKSDELPGWQLIIGWLAIVLMALFLIITAIWGIRRPSHLRNHNVKLGQNLFEILLLSIAIVQFNSAYNVLWMLYMVPMVSALRFLNPPYDAIVISAAIIAAIVTGATLSIELIGLSIPFATTVFGFLLLFVMRRTSLNPDAFADQKAELVQILQQYQSGICVIDSQRHLVFVNSALRQQFGPWTMELTCYEYLRCDSENCAACQNPTSQPQRITTMPAGGRKLQFDVESQAIADGSQILMFFNRPRTIRIDLYEDLLNTIVEGNEQRYEEALRRLLDSVCDDFNAETAAIFWLRDGRLKRAIHSGPTLDFDEYYEPGQGITGLTLLSAGGTTLGRTIVVNNLDESPVRVQNLAGHPLALPKYFANYKRALPSRQVRHLLAVPLNGRRGIIGVLRLVNRLEEQNKLSATGFQSIHEVDLNLICERLAHAIEHRELHRELQRQFAEIQRFYQIYHATARGQEVFETIVDEALKAFPDARKCEIRRLDRNTQTLYLIAARHRHGFDYGAPPSPLVGINVRAIRAGENQFVPDTTQDPDFVQRPRPIGALMVAPLIGLPGIIGILTVDYAEPREFTADERRRFEALAIHSRLAAAMIWRKQQSERLREHIQRIGDLGEGLKDVYRNVLVAYRDLIGYDSASIQLLEGTSLRIVDCDGFTDHLVATSLTFDITDKRFPHGWVVRGQQPLIIDDVPSKYPDFYHEIADYQPKPVSSVLYTPLSYRNRIIGIIALESHTSSFYRKDDVVLSLLIANAAASAIDNARLVAQLQLQQEQLRELLKSSTALVGLQDERKLLASYAQLGARLFSSEHCAIFLRHTPLTDFELAVSSLSRECFENERYQQIANTIAERNEVIHLTGTELMEFYAAHLLQGDELDHLPTARGRALLAGPIRDHRRMVVGVVMLENRAAEDGSEEFTDTDTELLALFAEQVWHGCAIVNLRHAAREQLGLDIHDLLNFVQSTIIFPLNMMTKQLERGEPATSLTHHLLPANHAAKFLYQQLQCIQDDLRGRTDLNQPFTQMIKEYVKLIKESRLPNVDFRFDLPPQPDLPTSTAYVLFRICQEALANIAKHAGLDARSDGVVWIRCQANDAGFVLTIEDNGHGISEDAINLRRRGAYGLMAIQQWAERIGGRATVQPRAEGGVVVRVTGQIKEGQEWGILSGWLSPMT